MLTSAEEMLQNLRFEAVNPRPAGGGGAKGPPVIVRK